MVLSGDTRYSENLIQFSQGSRCTDSRSARSRSLFAQRPVLQPGAKTESNQPPHHSGTGRNDLQPGETKARGLFAYRAVRTLRPGGAHQKNLFRTARSGRRPDELSKSGTRSKSIEPRNRTRQPGLSPPIYCRYTFTCSASLSWRTCGSLREVHIGSRDGPCSSCRQQRPIVAIAALPTQLEYWRGMHGPFACFVPASLDETICADSSSSRFKTRTVPEPQTPR